MDIILIGGLWLAPSAWDAVVPGLRAARHTPVTVALPGQGDGAASATLEDQLAAVLEAVDAADAPALVVGHSAAATLAWLAADRRPGRVAKVVFIGGMPTADGERYAPWFEADGEGVPFVGWEAFEAADIADLTAEHRHTIEQDAEPVPLGVAHGVVRYERADRFATPAVEVCPEFSPEDARGWLAGGAAPELAAIEQLELVDIDSGHWPMFSRPDELARVLAACAS